jgi:hypothetical protein
MESLFLLAVVFIIGIPLVAIVALVRVGGLRKLVDSQYNETVRTVSNLNQEIADLRNSLAKVSSQLDWQKTAARGSEATGPEASVRPAAVIVPPMEISMAQPAQTAIYIHPQPVEPVRSELTESASPDPEQFHASVNARALTVEFPSTSSTLSAESESAPEPAAHPAAVFSADISESLPASDTQTASPFSQTEAPLAKNEQLRPASHSVYKSYEPLQAGPPHKSFAERLRDVLPLEEVLGMNLFAKIGMVLLVLGFALLGRVALIAMGPAGKVALIYAIGAALLGGGIWLERKERYRLIGRSGIGGGWALLFFTTYAMYHVPAMHVLRSQTLDCVLLLGVAVAMVAHTLRYKSQLVTGLAFLLAFSTVALSQDTVYSLAAGVILAVAIVAIALKEGWYELEIFGILASYANHFYWLYKLYPLGMSGHAFTEFWPSAIILILYWLTFRISYVARNIRTPRDERYSTTAGLLNPALLLAVMKFQSTRPELAFYALLGLGAIEFFFGQLPTTRHRRPAFILLTILGTALMLGSVPFKFSGNSIALLWMIAAEMLIVAGIVQSEVIFRRLGLLAGVFTGLLVVYEAKGIVELRQHSEQTLTQNGILLLTCAALFYLNSHFIGRKWRQLFEDFDGKLMTAHSYIGCATAFIGVWALMTRDWTALGWAAMMLAAALGARLLVDKRLTLQAGVFAAAVVVRIALQNCHFDALYPHHPTGRLVSLPILAAAFYLAAAALSRIAEELEDFATPLRVAMLWVGTALLITMTWLDAAPGWVALIWMALAVALVLISKRIQLASFCYQEHVVAVLVGFQLITVNLNTGGETSRYLSFLTCTAALYSISRLCTFGDAPHRRFIAWAHTGGATALLTALAWHGFAALWIAVIWALFALALAAFDRVFDVEELPYQAHGLAALAVLRVVTLNLYTAEKWHEIDLRLITVSIVVTVLYAMSSWVRIPGSLREREVHHLYSWAGSLLAAWLLWSELQPLSVALGLAVFGLVLFEWGLLRKIRQLRLQAYLALTAAFGRIFFVNLTASRLPGEGVGPALLTVVPIALIYFFVWIQLQGEKTEADAGRLPLADIIAYFGTGSIVALLYFQTYAEWIIVAWAVLALLLLVVALLLDKEVFLQQGALLLFGIVGRGIAHNIFGGSYFTDHGWRGNFALLSLASALLLAALPVAFHLRWRYAERPIVWPPFRFLTTYLALRRPEQLFFFGPVTLATITIAVKMDPGMVTLAWGIEGVVVILLGIAVAQRTYRITGLLLLLLCVGKIVFRDAWHLAERDRYITFIVLGASLTLVSMLYNKFRESIRRLL